VSARPGGTSFLVIAGLAVVVAVAAALTVLGSPAHQRDLRFDERRAGDLGRLDTAIGAYWKAEGHLPASLADLHSDDIRLDRKDPQTGAPYGYRAIDTRHYALCAVFAADNHGGDADNPLPDFPSQWVHPAGRHCFMQSTSKIDEAVLDGGNAASPVTK